MIKSKKHIMRILTVAAIVAIVYVALNARQPRLATVSVDSVTAQIRAVLDSDPNYLYVDYFVVHEDDSNHFVPVAYVDYLNPRLQVIVRGTCSIRLTNPRRYIRLEKLLKRLPNLPRFNWKRILFDARTMKHQRIDICALEPTDEELQGLKERVGSLGSTHDIPIEFSVYFPDR